MSQWTFVIAAYVLTASGTLGLLGGAFLAMRRAEAGAAAAKRTR